MSFSIGHTLKEVSSVSMKINSLLIIFQIVQALCVLREVQVSTHLKTELHMAIHVTNTNPAQCNLESKLLDQNLNNNCIFPISWTLRLWILLHQWKSISGESGYCCNTVYSLYYTLYVVSTSRHLKKMLAVTAPPVLALQCRKIGDSSSVLEYTVSCGTDQSIDVTESVINKPDKFSGMSCKFTNVRERFCIVK